MPGVTVSYIKKNDHFKGTAFYYVFFNMKYFSLFLYLFI